MSVEVCSYRLSVRGKPVGSQVLETGVKGRTVVIEGKLQLQGSFGQSTTRQVSRAHRQRHFSYAFSETFSKRGESRTFEVVFDAQQGLVRAQRNQNDQASIPYLKAYRDPLSLLHEIRHLGDEVEVIRIPMLGKDVQVKRLLDVELETVLGKRTARCYLLYPGGSTVYLDAEPPHPILAMSQRTDEFILEAQLTQIGHENKELDAPTGPKGRKRGKRRRNRRGRRRS